MNRLTIVDGQQALIEHIVGLAAGVNVVTPRSSNKPTPRYVVQVTGGQSRSFGVNGSVEHTPEISVRVETSPETSVFANDNHVKELLAMFRLGTQVFKLRGDEHSGEIVTPPLVGSPLTGDGVYATPVIIRSRVIESQE